MATELNRRDFIKGSLLATAAGGALALGTTDTAQAQAAPQGKAAPASSSPEIAAATQTCPMGKIGKGQFSRLILGSNLITFYIHARDLKFVNNLARHYLTEEKILETLAISEQNGINTIMTQDDERYLNILKKYRNERGGKLQWIVAPKVGDNIDENSQNIRRLADEGVAAMYVHGNDADRHCAAGKKELIARTLEIIKLNDIPAGVGGHDLNVVRFCEQNNVGADFYVKTFHHHNYPSAPTPQQLVKPLAEVPGYWCKNPVETAEFMKTVQKPWIAFKVMAAGAIEPASAFKYSFEKGADFILAGMFDFEIAEDVRILNAAHAAAAKRERPWMG